MALEMRPNCEFCDKDLPPAALDACICSYECTFCRHCVDNELENVCPNCGGGFTARPLRPRTEWRPGLSLVQRPASVTRRHLSYGLEDIKAHILRIRLIAPEDR